jgi:hypothetical protein
MAFKRKQVATAERYTKRVRENPFVEKISGPEDPRWPCVGVHLKMHKKVVVQDCDVYCGRARKGPCSGGWNLEASKWANHDYLGNMEYEDQVRAKPELMGALHELVNKRLGCWCLPATCHTEVLCKLVREHLAEKK